MSTPTKLIMRWNIHPGSESDYFEFMVNEFIPGVRRMGLIDPQVWYTAFGNCEQILVSGVTETREHMRHIMRSKEWVQLKEGLTQLVDAFDQKVVPATGTFQL